MQFVTHCVTPDAVRDTLCDSSDDMSIKHMVSRVIKHPMCLILQHITATHCDTHCNIPLQHTVTHTATNPFIEQVYARMCQHTCNITHTPSSMWHDTDSLIYERCHRRKCEWVMSCLVMTHSCACVGDMTHSCQQVYARMCQHVTCIYMLMPHVTCAATP